MDTEEKIIFGKRLNWYIFSSIENIKKKGAIASYMANAPFASMFYKAHLSQREVFTFLGFLRSCVLI